MSWVGRLLVVTGVFLLIGRFPAVASAQDGLGLPTVAMTAAVAADWASTYHALKHYHLRETNPLLQRWQESPRKLISIGAVVDAGGLTAWNTVMGRNHPRVAVAGLWAMAAFRTYLAIHNVRNARQALRRYRVRHPDPDTPPNISPSFPIEPALAPATSNGVPAATEQDDAIPAWPLPPGSPR